MTPIRTPPAGLAAEYARLRREVAERPGGAADRRRALTRLTDGWLTELSAAAGLGVAGLALVAVGSYGRGEPSPFSDLDLVLLHAAGTPEAYTEMVAEKLWYPIWDAGVRLDHAVRSAGGARQLARTDLRVLLSMIEMRHITGDEDVTETVRRRVLADWRADAPARMEGLRQDSVRRWERSGDLAFATVGDLKQSRGGLRDLTVMRGVAASWVADCPHQGLQAARSDLLDVRDALHRVLGRDGTRLQVQDQDPIAAELGLLDRDALLHRVSAIGRMVGQAVDLTWHRVRRVLTEPPAGGRNRRFPLADGVVATFGEVVLARAADPERDPGLPLRVLAAAARNRLLLPPSTTSRLTRCPPLPVPWPARARADLLTLLGAGDALIGVWEAADQAGLITALLPEWERLRSMPQPDPVHRFTVDRHLVQTCVEAARLTRRVDRPDLLLLAALLHDIGKGTGRDHNSAGAEMAGRWLARMGVPPDDAGRVVVLVRHHLLLAQTATQRDPDDPATVAAVVGAVGDVGTLELLAALTEADALAAGPAAWTRWKSHQVAGLVTRVREALVGQPEVPAGYDARPGDLAGGEGLQVEGLQAERVQAERVQVEGLQVTVAPGPGAWQVTVEAPDRPGLLAAAAGVLTLHHLIVRACTARTVAGRAGQLWSVEPEFGDGPQADALRADLRRALDGSLDVAAALARTGPGPDATAVVLVLPDASARATVLQVRARDGAGLLHAIVAALAAHGLTVTAARVNTYGGDAVDTFYVLGPGGVPLDAGAAERAAAAVAGALRSGGG